MYLLLITSVLSCVITPLLIPVNATTTSHPVSHSTPHPVHVEPHTTVHSKSHLVPEHSIPVSHPIDPEKPNNILNDHITRHPAESSSILSNITHSNQTITRSSRKHHHDWKVILIVIVILSLLFILIFISSIFAVKYINRNYEENEESQRLLP